jgi:hypothetical protein
MRHETAVTFSGDYWCSSAERSECNSYCAACCSAALLPRQENAFVVFSTFIDTISKVRIPDERLL